MSVPGGKQVLEPPIFHLEQQHHQGTAPELFVGVPEGEQVLEQPIFHLEQQRHQGTALNCL